MDSGRKLFKRSDIIIIFCIAAAAAAYMFIFRQTAVSGTVCRILYDGKTVRSVNLGEDGVFHIPEAPYMEFEIKDGKIAAVHSDCPDKVCVRTGFIGLSGQKIVCLPNKVVVSVDAEDSGDSNSDAPDMVAQ